jgi:hypothetical protein
MENKELNRIKASPTKNVNIIMSKIDMPPNWV